MEKVYISESGPQVSAAIYSFWRYTTTELYSHKNVEAIINYNLELGVNTFDHSNRYSDGKAEELFGDILTGGSVKRENLVICTKAGIRKTKGNREFYDLSADYLVNSVHTSLKRLRTDYIDIFSLEHYDPLYSVEETASALTKLLLSGKIRYIGVSNFNVFQHRLLASYLPQPIVTNHLELNLLQTSAINDGRLDFIREQYSKPMAYAPLAGGRILSGNDRQALKIRIALGKIAEKYDGNIEQTAVAWLYKLGALPIIGSDDKTRIKNAATANTIKLTNEDWYYLYQAAN